MNIIEYIMLGLLQGLTEPLPISSSGHLRIIRYLVDGNTLNDLNFEILLNFGSLVAIILIYFKDIKKLCINGIKYIRTKKDIYITDFRYIILLIVATIPAGLIGLLFKDAIEKGLARISIVGISLLVTAGFLILVRNIKGKKDDKKITILDSIIIGLFQVVALIPGISRSGATIIASMFRGFKRDTALRFSFLLYIPVSLASFILGMMDVENLNEVWLQYLLGITAAGIMTFFATKWFIDIVKKGKLIYFAIYCTILGTLVLLFM